MKILMITGPGYDDIELFYAYYRLMEAGFDVDIASAEKGVVNGVHSQVEAKFSYGQVNSASYAGLVLPGGSAPEMVRLHKDAVKIAGEFMTSGRPVAAICHGQQILISANVLKGKTCTCYATICDDIKNAGANYADQPVVVDGNLVTSRCPQDLPGFIKAFLALVEQR